MNYVVVSSVGIKRIVCILLLRQLEVKVTDLEILTFVSEFYIKLFSFAYIINSFHLKLLIMRFVLLQDGYRSVTAGFCC